MRNQTAQAEHLKIRSSNRAAALALQGHEIKSVQRAGADLVAIYVKDPDAADDMQALDRFNALWQQMLHGRIPLDPKALMAALDGEA